MFIAPMYSGVNVSVMENNAQVKAHKIFLNLRPNFEDELPHR